MISRNHTDRGDGDIYVERTGERDGIKSANVCMPHFSILVHRLHQEREYSESNERSGDVARIVILRFSCSASEGVPSFRIEDRKVLHHTMWLLLHTKRHPGKAC